MPSYHDLHITTPSMERRSIFDMPYGYEVSCTRVTGWQLWVHPDGAEPWLLAGEYGGPEWLILDVDGHVIVDSRETHAQPVDA